MRLLLDFLVHHGYLVLFVWILAEQAALPLPSVPLLLACGALARSGQLNFVLVVCCGVAAALAADNLWFQIGRRRGSSILRFICRVALEPDSCVRQTENSFLKYGSRSLLFSKFVPGLNTVAAPLAGITGLRPGRFLLFDTLGSLIWIVSYASLGYALSDQLELVGIYAMQMGSNLALILGGTIAAWIAFKFLRRHRFLKDLSMARITAEELRQKLEAGDDILILDLRSIVEKDEDSIPGSLRVTIEDLATDHHKIPRDRDIVLYCT